MYKTCLVRVVTRLFFLLLLNLGTLNVHVGLVVGCYEAEREALLEFKQSLVHVNNGLSSWEGNYCCTWEGVGCDNVTAHVNHLDLHNPYCDPFSFYVPSFLIAPKLDHSLLELRHLNYLDLSCNNFFGSQIPGFIGLFKHLSHLNLSFSNFSGVFPSQLGNLPRLNTLDLSYNSLEGTLPQVFANMTSLTYLDLSSNNFDGSIPIWVTNMRKLEHLDVRFNSFSRIEEGTIMGILGNQCNLKTLDLSYNSIEDTIGVANHTFSKCLNYDLEILQLSSNMIGGTLPSWLGDFKYLRLLDLSHNIIEGHIPVSLGSLSFLEELDLSHNTLNGTIPQSLGQCTSLVSIRLSSNFLQGVLSESHLANLSRLDYLSLSFNPLDMNFSSNWSPPFQLSEFHMKSCNVQTQFPRWIGEQTKLYVFDLSDNYISGELVQWFPSIHLTEFNISHNHIIGRLPYFSSTQLFSIDISYNLLSGTLLNDDPTTKNDIVGTPICQLPNLKFLDLQRNNIVGTIHGCWGYSDYLTYINLSSNNLSGIIPMSMGLHQYLGFLILSNNSLQGPIPPTFSNSSNLQVLDLGENKLVGNIPITREEKTHPLLKMLRLRGNQLTGVIPPTLCSLPKLQFIDLAHNNLTGGIPRCFGNITRMKSSPSRDYTGFVDGPAYVRAFHSDPREDSIIVVLKGAAMLYTTTLKFVVNLDLSCNALVGYIPEEITNLSGLIGLNLSHNHLTGNIPRNIGEMRLLESLDLSNNNLSGTIPSSLSALTSLTALNLSYNKLHGQIPTGSQLQTLNDPSVYEGNPGLCGDPLPNKCKTSHDKSQPRQEQEEHDKVDNWETPLFYFVIFSGFATGFWGVVGSLLLKRRFRFALFQLLGNIADYLYVQVMVRINRMMRN